MENNRAPAPFTDCVFIKKGPQFFKVRYSEIDWVRSEKNYCTIVANGKRFLIKTSLKKIKTVLPPNAFIQIHKSFIIRLDSIERINFIANQVFTSDQAFPIGRNFKAALQQSVPFLK